MINEKAIFIDNYPIGNYPIYKLSIGHQDIDSTIIFYFGGMSSKGLFPEYWQRVRRRYHDLLNSIFSILKRPLVLYFFPHGGSKWYPLHATKTLSDLKSRDDAIKSSTNSFYIGHSYGGFITLGIFLEGKHKGYFSIYGPSLNYELTYINQWLKRFSGLLCNHISIFCNKNDSCLAGTQNAINLLDQYKIDYTFKSNEGKHRFNHYKLQMLQYFEEWKES